MPVRVVVELVLDARERVLARDAGKVVEDALLGCTRIRPRRDGLVARLVRIAVTGLHIAAVFALRASVGILWPSDVTIATLTIVGLAAGWVLLLLFIARRREGAATGRVQERKGAGEAHDAQQARVFHRGASLCGRHSA